MYIARSSWTNQLGKTYYSVWLKESYREHGKVKSRYLLNLKDWSEDKINALELALKLKSNVALENKTEPDNSEPILVSPKQISLEQGLSVGALFTVHQVAERLGIVGAFGSDVQGKLALWQVYARVLEQGSRLSAIRMANLHAVTSILQFNKAFTENDLYKNLKWLDENQKLVEDKLFASRYSKKEAAPNLFLYRKFIKKMERK